MRWETEGHFLVGTVILGFLFIFKKSQESSTFQAINSQCLSRCQSDVIPPGQMRRRSTAFFRVSTGDSDISSSCDMKHDPNLSHCREIRPFFESGFSRYIPLETESTDSLSPTIPEGKLHLRCLWKTGSPLQSKTGNQLSS